MGQRSQIYIAFNNALRDDKGKVKPDAKGEWELIARYYQWNYGSRMISRTWGLIEWIQSSIMFLNFTQEKLKRIADVNFDLRDVVISSDLIAEAEEDAHEFDSSANEYIFAFNNCNDGKLFISVEDDGTIKYCLTDNENFEPISAKQYMAWGEYSSEEPESNLWENIQNISDSAELMTQEELEQFMARTYCNVKEYVADAGGVEDA